jgi:hypothetical protein
METALRKGSIAMNMYEYVVAHICKAEHTRPITIRIRLLWICHTWKDSLKGRVGLL